EPSVTIKHRLVTKISVCYRLAELAQNMFWNLDHLDTARHNFKIRSLQNDFRISLMQCFCVRSRRLQKCREISFPSPDHQRAPNKLGLCRENQAQIVVRIDPATVARLI